MTHKTLSGKNHPNWEGGLPNCVDCNERLGSRQAKRCNSCAGKLKVFSEIHRKNLSLAHKGKPQPWNRGENHFNWKGGTRSINEAIRASLEYEEWRTKVFRRDNYTCQICYQIGGYLQADHIRRFADYPKLRFEISNGQTLCLDCHKEKTREEGKMYWRNQYKTNMLEDELKEVNFKWD